MQRKSNMIRAVAFLVMMGLTHLTVAQQQLSDSLFVLPDSVKVFSIESFYEMVVKNHPVAKQAALLSEVARQEIRLARGNFDPKLQAEYFSKVSKGQEYYSLFDASVKMPTRSPVTPVVGTEKNTGDFVNPENYISDQYNYQQVYAGVAVPLLQGLLTDDRRTALKQAQLFTNLMEAEQVKMLNKLLLEAAKDYWGWYYSYYNYRLATNTARIAEQIFRAVKFNFEGGEIAPIDTVQAKITYLERKVSQQEALTDFMNTTLQLSNYLWDSLANPLNLPTNVAPFAESELVTLPNSTVEELINRARTNHPELRKINVKIGQLELDKRLAIEYMKPRLDVSYYWLNQPFTPNGESTNINPDDNYKLGLDFEFPLFLRKERAKLAQTRLKLSNANYERDLTTRQIINDINAASNQLQNNAIVLQQQRLMVDNYLRLMNAELLNLENGESDFFKIGIQQEKLYNAQTKLLKTIAEYEKQKAVLYWSAGVTPMSNEK